MINEDVWKIIKSYLFDKRDIQYRLYLKQKLSVSRNIKWKRILLIDRIREKYENSDEH